METEQSALNSTSYNWFISQRFLLATKNATLLYFISIELQRSYASSNIQLSNDLKTSFSLLFGDKRAHFCVGLFQDVLITQRTLRNIRSWYFFYLLHAGFIRKVVFANTWILMWHRLYRLRYATFGWYIKLLAKKTA